MKTTANKRVVILSELESPYFEQTIFILKENVIKEEEKLLNEARSIVDKYMKRCERGSILVHAPRKRAVQTFFTLTGGAAAGALIVLLTNLL